MVNNSTEVLEEDESESVERCVRVVDNGKGMAARARAFVTPIALRYVKAHQQHLFHLQAMRWDPTSVDMSAEQIPTRAEVQYVKSWFLR